MRPPSCEHDDPCAEPPLRARPDASFEALFRAHFGFVYQNLRRLGVPPASVEDAAQEVFVVVLRRWGAPVGSIRGWLFGIARRVAWRHRRASARRTRLVQALAAETPLPADGPAVVAEREAAALLEQFLDRLDDDKRAVFLLAELEQMTAPEIARALGVKENTVYSRLRAARQEFDRNFERLRLRERRVAGEVAADPRALLLSRARRAYEPTPASRQRVWIALWAPAGAATGAGAGAGATSSGGSVPPGVELTAAAAGGQTAWVAVVGLAGLIVIAGPAAGLDPGAAAGRPAPVSQHGERDMSHESSATANPAAAAMPDAGPTVPFARLQAAAMAATAAREATTAGRPRTRVIGATSSSSAPSRDPEDMSEKTGSTSGPGQPVDAEALRREAALMADARAELRAGAWERARGLLDRHAREFPGGALVEERRLSLITALCSSGQVAPARAEAGRIAEERPGSAFARRAAALCPANSATIVDRSGP